MKKILKIITLLVLILPLTTQALTYDNVYYNISDYYEFTRTVTELYTI